MAAGRLVFGIGAETFNVATLAAIVHWFSGRHLAFAIASRSRSGAPAPSRWIFRPRGSPAPTRMAGSRRCSSPRCSPGCLSDGARILAPRPQPRRDPSARGRAHVRLARPLPLSPPSGSCSRSACFGTRYIRVPQYVLYQVLPACVRARPRRCRRDQRHRLPRRALRNAILRLARRPHRTPRPVARRGHAATAARSAGDDVSRTAVVDRHGADRDQLFARARGARPLASMTVPAARVGTAFAVLSVGLNVGIAAANLAAGGLNDAFVAGAANPAGYAPMMLLFAGCGAAGFGFALGSGPSTDRGDRAIHPDRIRTGYRGPGVRTTDCVDSQHLGDNSGSPF